MHPRISLRNVAISTPSRRPLFTGLNLRLEDEHVALVGRNGVGKSTLLAVLAGAVEPDSGALELRGGVHFVPQIDESARAQSSGERRRAVLDEARRSGAQSLLLDEPSEYLDEAGVEWLRSWLSTWRGALIVASHDRRLLADFRHFFVVSENGCRYFGGSLEELEAELESEHHEQELCYARSLNRLASKAQHNERVARRRARKKRRGRVNELDRATPRIRLNQKRDHAQVYQGRLQNLREERMAALCEWTQSTRRALSVELSLELLMPTLPHESADAVLCACSVSASVNGRTLFESLDLRLGRRRIAVVGPNGAGKTTLLETLLGTRAPASGVVRSNPSKVGSIAQGGANWMLADSLLDWLHARGLSVEESAALVVRHRFPLSLAARALRSLSPGERARAALICLFSAAPAVEVLVLDEPTFSLDLVAQRALSRALQAWPGGLVVASHDRQFLEAVGIEQVIELGAR